MIIMKWIYCLLIFLSLNAQAQYIDGPANIRDRPNGVVLFELLDLAEIDVKSSNDQKTWSYFELSALVEIDRISEDRLVLSSSPLYNMAGDTIGICKADLFPIKFNSNHWTINKRNFRTVLVSGWTFNGNIKNASFKDLMRKKRSYSDECINTFQTYISDGGEQISKLTECDFVMRDVLIDDEWIPSVIRIEKEIFDHGSEEHRETTLKVEVINNVFEANDRSEKSITIEADDVDFVDKKMIAITRGCCAAPDKFKLFEFPSFTPIMEFESKMLRCHVPNSKIKGYIAFQRAHFKEEEIIGSLYLVINDEVVNTVVFKSSKEDCAEYKNFPIELSFTTAFSENKLNESADFIQLISQKGNKSHSAISDFSITMEFWNDTKENAIIELPVKKGLIQGRAGKFELIIQ